MRKSKTKKQPTHKLVSNILHPKDLNGCSVSQAVCNEFFKFVLEYKYDNFNDVVKVVLKDDRIKNNLNAFCTTPDSMMSKPIFDAEQIPFEKLLSIYKWLFIHNESQLIQFEESQIKIENWLVTGNIAAIEKEVDLISENYGDSFWLINMKLLVAFLKDDREFLEGAHDKYKNNESYIFNDIVARKSWLFQLHDTTTYVENITTRTIGELRDGLATDAASLYALSLTKYPLYNEIETFHSIYELQQFPLIDIYMFLCESLSQTIKKQILEHNPTEDELRNGVPSIFFELAEVTELKRVGNVLSLIDSKYLSLSSKTNLEDDIDVKNYSRGDYKEIINNFENNLESLESIISKVNIIAKSYIKTNQEPSIKTPKFTYEVITNLIKIYQLRNVNESISNIISLATKLNFLEVSDHLLVSIVKSAPYYLSKNKVLLVELCTKEFFTPVTPLAKKISLSPLTKNNVYGGEIKVTKQFELRKELANLHVSEGNSSEKSLLVLDELKKTILIEKDYLEIEFDYYLKNGLISELISIAADNLVKNHQSLICLPMDELCSLIRNGDFNSIDSVIVSHFYNNNTKKQNETLLNESFEDFIIQENDLRPSSILEMKKSITEKETYFFNEICHPQLMAYMGCYTDSYDLLMERVKIVTILKSKFNIDKPNLETEIIDIIDELIVDSGANKLSNAKIHIDLKHLINKKRNDIESLTKLYHEENEQSEDAPINMGLPTSNKDKIVHKIINSLMIEFLDNNDVGLDKNLSSEIKHGFFSDLICSKFNENNLITELDLEGNYQSNEYWLTYYEIVSRKIMSGVDKSLNTFTNNFHKLIEEAESWMKVSWDSSHPERVFSFIEVSYEEFLDVKYLVMENSTPDKIGELVYSIMLELLDDKLEVMKDKLNGEYAYKLDKLIATLIEDINRHKGTAALTDLTNAINTVRNGVKEDIKTASEWFSLSNDKDLPSLSLSKVLKIGERCFSKFTNHKPDIIISDNCAIEVDGRHISSIVLTLINTLNNACKYGKGNNIYLDTKVQNGSGFVIYISNEVSSVRERKLREIDLPELTNKLENLKNEELLRTQGGTGLYRSLHELRLCSRYFNLVPYVENNKFVIKVSYEDINC